MLEALGASNMVFITAGMGGGTGTGAAPVIARVARESGILTVGVVTKPFHFEGGHRMQIAEAGIEELQKFVDTLIIIPNQNLFRVANERTTFADAFKMADDVLHSGVRGVTDLMVMPGLINLDFADIRTVMSEMGKAMMGTGDAEGEPPRDRRRRGRDFEPVARRRVDEGREGVLINITGGPDMTLFEVDEAANRIREEVDPEANIIFGSTFDETLSGKMRISPGSTLSPGAAGDQPRQQPRGCRGTAARGHHRRLHPAGIDAECRRAAGWGGARRGRGGAAGGGDGRKCGRARRRLYRAKAGQRRTGASDPVDPAGNPGDGADARSAAQAERQGPEPDRARDRRRARAATPPGAAAAANSAGGQAAPAARLARAGRPAGIERRGPPRHSGPSAATGELTGGRHAAD